MFFNLLNLLMLLTRDTTRFPPRKSVAERPWLAVGLQVLFMVTLIATAAIAARLAWDIQDWSAFWIAMFAALFLLAIFIWLPFSVGVVTPRSLWAARQLRSVLARVNDRLAPPLVLQPQSVPTGELPAEPQVLGRLGVPMVTRSRNTRGSAILAILFIALFVVPGLAGPFIYGHTLIALALGLFWFVILMALPIGAAIIGARRNRVSVTVDSTGVTWGRPTEPPQRLNWGEMRSLVRLPQSTSTSNTSTATIASTYVATGDAVSLVWTVTPLEKAESFDASERLLRILVTQTGLPLRDASALGSELGAAGTNIGRVVMSRLAGFTTNGEPEPPKRRVTPRQVIMGTLTTLVIVGVLAVGGWLQWYQAQYQATLPQRAAQTTPLYLDALVAPDGHWPLLTPNANDGIGTVYIGGHYQLNGTIPGKDERITSDATFGDGVYTVATTQSGIFPVGQGDGIGMIFHANTDRSEFLLMQVSYNGYWSFYHYKFISQHNPRNWAYLDGGFSDAVMQDSGAHNTLMVFTTNKRYDLYVNSHLVDRYKENSYDGPLPTSGHIGLYLNEQTLIGDFNDFAVYAVPPQDIVSALGSPPSPFAP